MAQPADECNCSVTEAWDRCSESFAAAGAGVKVLRQMRDDDRY